MLQRSLRSLQLLSRECPAHRTPRAPSLAFNASRRIRQQGALIHTNSRLCAAAEGQKTTSSPSSEPPLPTDSQSQAPATKDPAKEKIESQEREIIDLKDKYLRSVADFRNLQERTKRDVSSAREFSISRFAKDLLDTVDNLDRALSTVPAEALAQPSPSPSSDSSAPVSERNKDLINLYSGLKMTEEVLMQTLAKHGLERYDPAGKGDRFDPNLHEASFMAPAEGKEDGAVMATVQTGFTLNGRVLRAAKVGVVKNS